MNIFELNISPVEETLITSLSQFIEINIIDELYGKLLIGVKINPLFGSDSLRDLNNKKKIFF